MKSFKEEHSHKYHGQDENFGYVGPLNPLDKALVTADYKKRVRKIWSREIFECYKKEVNAHFLHKQPGC